MDIKILVTTFRNVILAGVYIFGISQFLFYGGRLAEGTPDHALVPFVMLLLLSLSAAVVGSLIFGQAVMLFLENKKSESIKSVMYSIAWLFLLALAAVVILVIIN